jgi:hypothetical protein
MASKPKKKPARKPAAPAAPKPAPSAFEAMVVKNAPRKDEGRRSWWARVFGKKDAAQKQSRVDAKQMAELRASVMGELAARNRGGHVASHPFESAVLPEGALTGPSGRSPRRGGDWLFTAFVCVALVAIVLLLLAGGRGPAGPEGTLTQLRDALQRGDDAAFAKAVDMPKVADSVVDQLFGTPALDIRTLPPALKPPVSSTAAALAAMVKPGLAQDLADEMKTAVAEKGVYGDGTSLLKRLWTDAGGDHLQWGVPHLTREDDDSAAGEVMVTRDDSGQVAEVLVMELAREGNAWKVVALPNAGQVLGRLTKVQASMPAAAQVAAIEPGTGPAPKAVLGEGAAVKPLPPRHEAGVAPGVRMAHGKGARTRDIVLSRIDKTEGSPDAMKMSVVVTNTSRRDAHRVVLHLTVGDAAGVPLQVIELDDRRGVPAGASLTRVLDIPVRDTNVGRMVAELPLSALTVQAKVVAVR